MLHIRCIHTYICLDSIVLYESCKFISQNIIFMLIKERSWISPAAIMFQILTLTLTRWSLDKMIAIQQTKYPNVISRHLFFIWHQISLKVFFLRRVQINFRSGNGFMPNRWQVITGLILGLHPANERCRYKLTPYLIGWAQIKNQSCITSAYDEPISLKQIHIS